MTQGRNDAEKIINNHCAPAPLRHCVKKEEEPHNRGFLTLFSSPPTLKSKNRIPTGGPKRFEMKSFT